MSDREQLHKFVDALIKDDIEGMIKNIPSEEQLKKIERTVKRVIKEELK